MNFQIPKETYTGGVPEITFGKEKKVSFGGEFALPFYFLKEISQISP